VRIGLIVNPIAGMGGRVGLKGTDDSVERAMALGAKPDSEHKATICLRALKELFQDNNPAPSWLTAGGTMGANSLRQAGFEDMEVIYEAPERPLAQDTQAVARILVERKVELIVFCGGDGTARDISRVTGESVPILGIPAGVKMFSGVFGTSPVRTAHILYQFLCGQLEIGTADVLDLDEQQYRQGKWVVRLCDIARVPVQPTYIQSAKSLITGVGEADSKHDIAETIYESACHDPDTLYVLGPGSTVSKIGNRFGIRKTLLGIDAVKNGVQVGTDLNEQALLKLLDSVESVKLVLSPIGAQGFVLGRGNLQISSEVLKRIGFDNLIIVATPGKLARTPSLRFDTGDSSLDESLGELKFLPVVTGYRQRRMVRVII
jgi:predicted polyphosphate/ATP-dependent NAD kinase